MSLPIDQIVSLYSYLLAPIPLLAEFGVPVSTLDIVGTLRLALVVQQIKHSLRLQAASRTPLKSSPDVNEKASPEIAPPNASRTTDTAISSIWSMLVIVYGGELFVSSFVSQPPSFFTSPIGPLMLTLGHFAISLGFTYAPTYLPMQPSLKWELPLSIVDAFTRSVLLCSIGPPTILGHKSVTISDSATALLLTSTIMANGGFFIVNTFSMLSPSGWAVATPPELQPNGWTSLDLLSAPFITALFATLTQSQTTWRQATTYIPAAISAFNQTVVPADVTGEKVVAVPVGFDPEHARALCALLLVGLFSGRTIKNFGGLPALMNLFRGSTPKVKVQ